MSLLVLSSSSSSFSQLLDEPVRSLSFESSKRMRVMSGVEKMKNNFLEALRQHGLEPELLPCLEPKPAQSPLYVYVTAHSKQGKRKAMEDAHFDCPLREGHIIGLFDGHSEKGALARQVANLFKTQFQAQLDAEPDVRKLFINLMQQAQDEVPATFAGTTALVAYFHNVTNQLYTATLGDSELKIYRKVGDEIFSIPVSVIRHWGIEKEEKRFLSVVDDAGKKERWLAETNPENRRFPPESPGGLNVSRSIGEKLPMVLWKGETAISRKPKVSMCQVVANAEAEDKIVLACDGLWHFVGPDKLVNEQRFIDEVIKPHWNDPNLSERIVDFALNVAESTDNVTAMVATVKSQPREITPPLSRQTTIPIAYE